MDEEDERLLNCQLVKACTFKNFKKLLLIVYSLAEEGISVGKVDCGELLFCDILNDVSYDEKLMKQAIEELIGEAV